MMYNYLVDGVYDGDLFGDRNVGNSIDAFGENLCLNCLFYKFNANVRMQEYINKYLVVDQMNDDHIRNC